MNVNIKKTKEIVLGPAAKLPQQAFVLNNKPIDRVRSFKLLSVVINDSLTWDDHVAAICSKASKRLYFLKLLKRSGLTTDDLTLYYQSVIRSVLEYACPVWHSSLSAAQIDRIESVQRRALCIITGVKNMNISERELPSLSERRDEQTLRVFTRMTNSVNCLHHLLPPQRDTFILEKLHDHKQYPVPYARTARFQNSFLLYALRTYQ